MNEVHGNYKEKKKEASYIINSRSYLTTIFFVSTTASHSSMVFNLNRYT